VRPAVVGSGQSWAHAAIVHGQHAWVVEIVHARVGEAHYAEAQPYR
jgi:hypothetical protein